MTKKKKAQSSKPEITLPPTYRAHLEKIAVASFVGSPEVCLGEIQYRNAGADTVNAFREVERTHANVLEAIAIAGAVVGGAFKASVQYHDETAEELEAHINKATSEVLEYWEHIRVEAGVSDQEAADAFYSAATYAAPTAGVFASTFLAQRTEDVTSRSLADNPGFWPQWSKREGSPKSTSYPNVRALMDRWGLKVWRNVLDQRQYLTLPTGDDVMLDGSAIDVLWGDMQAAGLGVPLVFLRDVIRSVAASDKRNPFAAELEQLQTKWDGVSRIDQLFPAYAGVEDTPLHRAWSKSFMLTMVRRVRKPGSELYGVPILEAIVGGEGKSTFAKVLVGNPKYFSESLPLSASPKEVVEEVRGKVLVEFSELRGMRSSQDFDAIKAMITRSVDTARVAYAHEAEDAPRYFVMIGSTNQQRYLKNDGGLRRFWTMDATHHPADLVGLKRDREQLWAEAAYLEAEATKNDLDINVPRELWPEEAKVREARILRPGVIQNVVDALRELPDGATIRSSDLQQLCTLLGAPGDMVRNVTEWVNQLTREGWNGSVRKMPRGFAGVGTKAKAVRVWVKGAKAGAWYKLDDPESPDASFVPVPGAFEVVGGAGEDDQTASYPDSIVVKIEKRRPGKSVDDASALPN